MKLTRRELLQRLALLSTALPLSMLPDIPGSTDDVLGKVEIDLVESAVDMYFFYPSVATGWACKECKTVNGYYSRKCVVCWRIEFAIPETWTCPDCKETQVWAERCSCYPGDVLAVKDNKINPFWIG